MSSIKDGYGLVSYDTNSGNITYAFKIPEEIPQTLIDRGPSLLLISKKSRSVITCHSGDISNKRPFRYFIIVGLPNHVQIAISNIKDLQNQYTNTVSLHNLEHSKMLHSTMQKAPDCRNFSPTIN